MSANHTTEIAKPELAREQAAGEAEFLHTSIQAGTAAQIVIAAIAVIGLIYLLKLVLVTILGSILLAYVLEPLVSGLKAMRIPRGVGALIAVLLALAFSVGLGYLSYYRAVEFTHELSNYSARIGEVVAKIQPAAVKIEDPTGKRPVPLNVEISAAVARLISEDGGSLFDTLLAIGFVPFLVYFMLTWKDHTHLATVQLFPKEHRLLAHHTVGTISAMIRTYIIANLAVGLLNAAVCAFVFWLLGIRYFYFIGAISGFISLVPYFGAFLALLPPLAGGIDGLDKTGIIVVLVTVVGVHVLTTNVIYPKFIGKRLRLNPLAVSLSLLFWAWIWGAPGLILAIPLLSSAKIVFDHIDPLRGLGSWLGESPRSSSA